MARHFEKYIDIEKLFSLGTKYAEEKLPEMNLFWKDVFKAYLELNSKNEFRSPDTFLASSLFYNDNLKIGREVIYFRQFYEKGIRFINDMINTNNNFFTLPEFQQHSGININFLQYHGLVSSLKSFQKRTK